MNLGRVTGTLVASRARNPCSRVSRSSSCANSALSNGETSGGYVVAVDSVGAGVGEVVLYASGSSARQTQATKDKPCDAVIMAIVDQWDLDGETDLREVTCRT